MTIFYEPLLESGIIDTRLSQVTEDFESRLRDTGII